MALQVGSQIAHYKVTALIGEGGMGQVWRATDTKLNRQVALKILPEAFASDPDRLARFQREAQVLASLNHSGIAGIYGLEEQDNTKALVLELVEGPTLADRIAQGPIPVDEALPIAKQIAEALEAAHEQGIIHRDLKPANIKLPPDGRVKVLDFGLAKALDSVPEGDPNQSPTLTAAATQMGVIMGTAAYMSPEQARGKPVDKRADIWAFGCVFYEMLTGQRAFDGEDVSLTLSSVLQAEPDWTRLPTVLSPSLSLFLRRAVEKNPKQRLGDIRDVRLAMEGAFDAPPLQDLDGHADASRSWSWQGPVTTFALGLVVASASVAAWFLTREIPQPVTRFVVALPPGTEFAPRGRHALALSPDAGHLAYAADDQLYLRPMRDLRATPIPSTQGAQAPFFSSNGRWLGFWQEGHLKKISLAEHTVVSLTEVGGPPIGVDWGADDVIVFAQDDGIWQVPGTGGAPRPLIEVDDGELAHGPQMLPGGRWVLFTFRPRGKAWADGQIVAQDLETGERRVLVEGGRNARYLATGHLVYATGDALVATRFDPATVAVTPGAVTLINGVGSTSERTGLAHFTLSTSGSLAYFPDNGSSGSRGILTWVTRDGQVTPLIEDVQEYRAPRLSSDDTRILFGSGGDIWLTEVERGSPLKLTVEGTNLFPVWTRDDAHVTFAASRSGEPFALYWQPADATDDAEVLVEKSTALIPGDWSPDGDLVFYEIAEGGVERNLWVRRQDGEVVSFLNTPFNERGARLSPDGKWVAYVSDHSGEDRIYVQPFPSGGRVVPISPSGGTEPVWSRDGTELFYRDGDQMMAVRVTVSPTFQATRPRALFRGPYVVDINAQGLQNYDVAADGRFLMVRDVASLQFVVVLNWLEELRARVPVD